MEDKVIQNPQGRTWGRWGGCRTSTVSELGLGWQDSLQAPVREGGSALTTVVFGWLPDGKVLWWKAPCLGGEVVSQIPPDI